MNMDPNLLCIVTIALIGFTIFVIIWSLAGNSLSRRHKTVLTVSIFFASVYFAAFYHELVLPSKPIFLIMSGLLFPSLLSIVSSRRLRKLGSEFLLVIGMATKQKWIDGLSSKLVDFIFLATQGIVLHIFIEVLKNVSR